MEEQTLYTTLLKGSIIGSLNYEGSYALVYAKFARENDLQKINFEELITKFGNLLEEEEELELEELFLKNKCLELTEHFQRIDQKYGIYFLEQISKKRECVELVYQDVLMRTNIFIDDEEIKNIKTIESLKKWEESHFILQKIVSNDEKAIIYFYKKYKDSINHLIFKNSGNEDDAASIINHSLSDLKIILDKLPHTNGYYQWQPVKTQKQIKANLFTYFYKICTYKWLDELRKRKIFQTSLVNIEDIESDSFTNDSMEDPYFQKKLIIRKAIEKLSNKCKKMYLGNWEENFEDNFNVEILAQKSGNSIGTIYNKNVDCMNELKKIVQSKNSN